MSTPLADPARAGLILVGLLVAALGGAAVGAGHSALLAVPVVVTAGAAGLAFAAQRMTADLSVLGYWGMAGAIFLVPLNGLRVAPFATYGDLLLLLAVPLVLTSAVIGNRMPRLPLWLAFGAAAITVSGLLVELFPAPPIQLDLILSPSSPVVAGGESLGSSLSVLPRLLLALVLVPLAIALAADSPRRLHVFADMWIAGVAISAAVALLDAYGGTRLSESLVGTDPLLRLTDRFTGLTVHPTTLGLTVSMATMLVLSRLTSLRATLLHLPVLALYGGAILVSGSRSAIVAVVIAGVALLAWHARARGQTLLIAAAILLAVAAFASSTSFSTLDRLTGDNSTVATSDTERTLLYDAGIEKFLERPLTGYGFQEIRTTHNVELQMLLSGGVLAMAGYLSVTLGALVAGFRRLGRLSGRLRLDLAGALLALVALLVSGLFYNDVYDRYLYVPVGLIMAILFMRRAGAGSSEEAGRAG